MGEKKRPLGTKERPLGKDDLAPFHCPACKGEQPFKSAWMLTRYSELNCVHCSRELRPIEATVPRFHALSGILAGVVGVLFYQELGFLTALVVIPLVLLLNCYFTSRSVKFRLAENV